VALPGGVDAEAWRPGRGPRGLRSALGIAGNVPVVGLLGGFRAMKGHTVALEALARLARAGRPFHAALVGGGSMHLQIRALRARLGLADRVTIMDGLVDAPEMVAGFDAALYVPLESDGMSRVLFEYLAAGRPVVASRVGVVPEVLVDRESALLVPGGEAGALADAVEALLADPGLGVRLGKAGRDLVERRLSGARVAEALAARYAALATPTA
jgi:glycosyltransferase involved in cell wall biosynthesis